MKDVKSAMKLRLQSSNIRGVFAARSDLPSLRLSKLASGVSSESALLATSKISLLFKNLTPAIEILYAKYGGMRVRSNGYKYDYLIIY